MRAHSATSLPWTEISRRRDLVLLAVLNGLNLLDAFLTWVVIRQGIAVEGNPVVEAIGLGGKVALVAFASVLLWSLRPRALLIPVVAYSAIVLYTLAGLVLSS